jgi:hypothetical protein
VPIDRQFAEKFWDVVRLYPTPPEKALGLCCAKKVRFKKKCEPARPARLFLYSYSATEGGLFWFLLVPVSIKALMDTAQEANLKSSPFYRAGQEFAFGNHDCPEPTAMGAVEPALGQGHALVEGLPAIGYPGNFQTRVAVTGG